MAGPLRADRVKETSTTTGTGTLNLAGTVTGAITFVSGIGTGNTVHYCIEHQTADEWEIGIGTVTSGSPDTLSRTTVISSSNSGSAVSFSSGTKNVFCVAPAEYGIPIIKTVTTHAIRVMKETALSSTLGNARGTGAVDFQIKRNNATKVASGNYSIINGGYNNTASNTAATIGGGHDNQATGGSSTCGGGYSNQATGTVSTIAGGGNNTASASRATVCGGAHNTASQNYNFAGGGYGNNCAGSPYSSIVGGLSNSISAGKCFVGGGQSNSASSTYGTVAGGRNNTASGHGSTVPGGRSATADKYCQMAYAAGGFSVNADSQTSLFVLRKSTTNATQTELFLDGSSARMTLANDSTWCFSILLVARRADANDESAGYMFQGVIDRNATAGTTALVGSVTKTVLAEDTSAWDADVDADSTNGSLRIQVTGESSKTIQWVAFVRTIETIG